jgi:hypothetical protein
MRFISSALLRKGQQMVGLDRAIQMALHQRSAGKTDHFRVPWEVLPAYQTVYA